METETRDEYGDIARPCYGCMACGDDICTHKNREHVNACIPAGETVDGDVFCPPCAVKARLAVEAEEAYHCVCGKPKAASAVACDRCLGVIEIPPAESVPEAVDEEDETVPISAYCRDCQRTFPTMAEGNRHKCEGRAA